MSSFIRCPECSFCIGAYAEFVEKAKIALYKSTIHAKDSPYVDYDPEKVAFNSKITPLMEPIFDAINIKNRCCRMHLMTKTDFDRMFK